MRRMGYDKELVLWCEYNAHVPAVWECKNIDCQINYSKATFKYEKGQIFELQFILNDEIYLEPIYVDTRMFQSTAVDALDSRYYTWRLQEKTARKSNSEYDAGASIDVDMKNNAITISPYISDFMYEYNPDVEYILLVKRIQ